MLYRVNALEVFLNNGQKSIYAVEQVANVNFATHAHQATKIRVEFKEIEIMDNGICTLNQPALPKIKEIPII